MTATKTKKKTELTAPESKRLVECEGVIEQGQQTFMEVGQALSEIRDGKLYRAKYKTFEQYTEAKWGWGAHRARQIINAVAVQKSVTKVTLLNEAAARQMGEIPEPHRNGVAKKAAKESGGEPINAAQIKEAAKEIVKPPKAPEKPSGPGPRPPKPVDEEGRAIHPRAAAALARTGEFQALEREAHALKRKILALAAEDIGRELNAQTLANDFKNICTALEWGRPWTSCPLNDPCTSRCIVCKGSQWNTHNKWNNHPKEFKRK